MCSCGVRPYPGGRRAPGKAWSSVSGGSTVGRNERVSYHSPWEDHGPVSCCSKICQDALPGKAAWLSAIHHCHCGDPSCDGISCVSMVLPRRVDVMKSRVTHLSVHQRETSKRRVVYIAPCLTALGRTLKFMIAH